MLGSRLRNGKQRLLMYALVVVVIILGLYLMQDTHSKLNEARSLSERCQQQQESLSAQLQVVYEHKSRLEKSLQQEKADHKKTKDDLQSQYQELQDKREKEKHDAFARFDSLQQQNKMLQNQNDDLQEELNKVQQSNMELIQSKRDLENTKTSQSALLEKKEEEINSFKAQAMQLQQDLERINRELMEKNIIVNNLEVHLKSCQMKSNQISLIGSKITPNDGRQSSDGLPKPLINNVPVPLSNGGRGIPEKTPDLLHQDTVKNVNPVNKNNEMIRENRQVHKEFPVSADDKKIPNELNKKNSVYQENSENVIPKPADPPVLKPSKYQKISENEPKLSNREAEFQLENMVEKPIQENAGLGAPGGYANDIGQVGLAPHQLQAVQNLDMRDDKNVHQLEQPHDAFPGHDDIDDGHQIVEPENGRHEKHEKDIRHVIDDHLGGGHNVRIGREEDFQGNGLEQQEIDGDQDLDEMDDEGDHQGQRDVGKAFDDADFDRVEENDPNKVQKPLQKQEGVIVAPR